MTLTKTDHVSTTRGMSPRCKACGGYSMSGPMKQEPTRAETGKSEFTIGEAELARALKIIGIGGYEHNAHFVDDRKWELDFYWREAKTSVEVMGGLWRRGKGAHRGLGQRRDYEKMNRCVMEGIRVLQFSTEMVHENPIGCAEMVKELLDRS